MRVIRSTITVRWEGSGRLRLGCWCCPRGSCSRSCSETRRQRLRRRLKTIRESIKCKRSSRVAVSRTVQVYYLKVAVDEHLHRLREVSVLSSYAASLHRVLKLLYSHDTILDDRIFGCRNGIEDNRRRIKSGLPCWSPPALRSLPTAKAWYADSLGTDRNWTPLSLRSASSWAPCIRNRASPVYHCYPYLNTRNIA